MIDFKWDPEKDLEENMDEMRNNLVYLKAQSDQNIRDEITRAYALCPEGMKSQFPTILRESIESMIRILSMVFEQNPYDVADEADIEMKRLGEEYMEQVMRWKGIVNDDR